MPSPVAHGLAGLAVSWLCRRPRALQPGAPQLQSRRAWLRAAIPVLALSVAADLDFLPGFVIGSPGQFHRGPTHSLGAAALVGLTAALVARLAGARTPWKLGGVLGLVFASHVLLDLLTLDFGGQIGIPLFWPFSHERVTAPFHVFLYIKRTEGAFLLSQLNTHNLIAVLWEATAMGGIVLALWWSRRDRVTEAGRLEDM